VKLEQIALGGHVLFAPFAVLLARWSRRCRGRGARLESRIDGIGSAGSGRSTFGTPSITALTQAVRPIIQLDGAHRDALRDAKRVAAEKRIEAILSHSRRRHYGHAAMLAAACVALAPTGRQRELITWIALLRQAYSRRSAFRQELTRALESVGAHSFHELGNRAKLL
jgi:hypothetical protein